MLNYVVCGFHFEIAYYQIGKRFIHVHHLKPLEEIGEEHKLDPEKDLRPVCLHCHDTLQKEKSPLSADCLKKLFIKYKH